MTSERGIAILTIEDEPMVRRTLAAYLRKSGFTVHEAGDGAEGLALFERERPDLVLVDLRMPGMDGFAVLEALSAQSPQTPLVVVSAADAIDDAIEAQRKGAWDYVMKPISPLSALGLTVEKVLERAELIRQNERYNRQIEETLRKIREDEKAGKHVQRRLLPPEQWRFGPYMLAHKLMSSMELSGDFVDYFAIDDEHLGFYTADVSGHGVSSALVTVIVKTLIRKYHEQHLNQLDDAILNPGALLEHLNSDLLNEDLEKHVSMFYGVLNRSRNLLRFSNGGQFPSPFLWSAQGAEVLREQGAAVGLFPFARYGTYEKRLPARFLLAIFSDGVLDILPQATLQHKLAFLRSLGSDAGIGRFTSVIQTNAQPPDDVTILTIKREGAQHGD
jgi:sigma-B regulation protein RsbU (phosphoserine phosphatase)